jgi:hypothetical protein
MMNSFTNSPFASANDYYPVLIFGNILTQANVPFYYIPLMFGIVTPISILILFLIGFHKTVKELKKPLHLLLFIWILVPIIIYAIINISIYNIIRHVLFLVPPLCILAGVGGAYLIKSLNKFIPKKKRLEKIFQTMIFIIIFSLPLIDTITYHPYQTTYFNRLIGGIKGAEENFELEYWGNSYKEGSKWLNENAEENATIIVPIAEWLPRYYLRKDISIKKEINTYEKNLYVMFMIDNTYKNNLMNTLESSKKSIHSIIIKRVPILQIYKLSKIEK